MRYKLDVYDDELNIVKTLEAPGIMWGPLMEVMESIADSETADENIAAMNRIMLDIFRTATSEDLQHCLLEDIVAVFQQVAALAAKGGFYSPSGSGQKN